MCAFTAEVLKDGSPRQSVSEEAYTAVPMTLRLDKPADERLHLALLTDAPNAAADCGDHFYIQNVERLTVLARFDAEPVQGEYEELIARHLPLHRQAMGDAELLLSDEDRPNEAMLDEAMESERRRSCMKSCG